MTQDLFSKDDFSVQKKVVTVSELTEDIKNLLEDNFASIWILGEVSNYKIASSGHVYFSLKDESAQVSAVIFRMNLKKILFKIEDGMSLIVHGRISLYSPRGQYQIIIDKAEPQGMGSLQLAFEQLKIELEKKGYFNNNYKKKLPYLPQKIALITSDKGAAIQDLKTVLRRRYPNINILICPVTVQGDQAKIEISRMIYKVNQRSDVDLIIMGRGGGSLEDLWAFNEEIVVQAIFDSEIPIISAVGHETDFSLSDFAADLRAPTPSAAAELAVPEVDQLKLSISSQKIRLSRGLNQKIQYLRLKINSHIKTLRKSESILGTYLQKLDDIRTKMKFSLKFKINNSKNRVLKVRSKWSYLKDNLSSLQKRIEKIRFQLNQQMMHRLQSHKNDFREVGLPKIESILINSHHNFKILDQRLKDLSPYLPLKRGYSLVKKLNSDKLLKNLDGLKLGDDIQVKFHSDQLEAKITKLEPR